MASGRAERLAQTRLQVHNAFRNYQRMEQGTAKKGKPGMDDSHPRLPQPPRLEATPDAKTRASHALPPRTSHERRRPSLGSFRRDRHHGRRMQADEEELHRDRSGLEVRRD